MKRISVCLALVLLFAVAACSNDPATQPQLDDFAAADAASILSTPTDLDDAEVPSGEEAEFSGEDGPFEVVMAGAKVDLVFRFNSTVRAREEVSITLRAVPKNGNEAVRGEVRVDFGDGRDETFNVRRTADITHTYRKAGNYRVRALLVDENDGKARGAFRIRVSDPLRVEMELHGLNELRPGETVELLFRTFDAESNGQRHVPGELTIDLGAGDVRFFKNFNGNQTFNVLYKKVGDYTIDVVFVSEGGREFVEKYDFEVKDGPANGDAIDLSTAIIPINSARDIANFAVTSQVTRIDVTPGQICIYHTKQSSWPLRDSVDGNVWVAAMYNGQLHAGTYEWVRFPNLCKGLGAAPPHRTVADMLGPHIKEGPFANWKPRKGDRVYLFASTHARLGLRTTNERSNVVEIIWPF